MFDLSWSELLLVAVVAILVIGPKDIPVVAKTVGKWVGKARRAGKEFMALIEDAADEGGLKEVKKEVEWESSKVTRLMDLEGKEQIAYDLDDVEKSLGMNIKAKKTKPKQKKRKSA